MGYPVASAQQMNDMADEIDRLNAANGRLLREGSSAATEIEKRDVEIKRLRRKVYRLEAKVFVVSKAGSVAVARRVPDPQG